MNKVSDIISTIERAIVSTQEHENTNHLIQSGYDNLVDEYRKKIETAHSWLEDYQLQIMQETGISSLKIKYTSVHGYFIEISKTKITKLPEHFVQVQTLVNSLRFTTAELEKFTLELSESEQNLAQREKEIFDKVCLDIFDNKNIVQQASETLGTLDFLSSLAITAEKNNYVCPEVYAGTMLQIEGGRHPVIEEKEKDFVKNSLKMDSDNHTHIITGPNMGGKSTFLRQNALIILMAHMGGFVPAISAKIPITDAIFSRVGAYDNLYAGASTFMVEMQEMGYILDNASDKSFVIVDEIGRGTSTHDGMSLAASVLKFLHDRVQSKTLFATHYHELIDFSHNLKHSKNFSVAVGENEENLIFLRKVIAGGMRESYGIEVAKLAGLPEDVIENAKDILLSMQENSGPDKLSSQLPLFDRIPKKPKRESMQDKQKKQIIENIKKLKVDEYSPKDALDYLYNLKEQIESI